jgi:PBSX family phage portal protein
MARRARTIRNADGVTPIAQALKTQALRELVDPFSAIYGTHALLSPAYNPTILAKIHEESDAVSSCVQAYVQNVHGFGYTLKFIGDDLKEKESPRAALEYDVITDFCDLPNGEESLTSIREKEGFDYESLGYSTIEAVRDAEGYVALLSYVPAQMVRMTAVEKEAYPVDMRLRRRGQDLEVKVLKNFRRFAQIAASGELIWFREFGDPRPMDRITGSREQVDNPATELIFRNIHFGGLSYGVPRWIGAVLDAVGLRNSSVVNLDLFNNQGIPAFMVLVTNGTLTDESLQELDTFINSMRGLENFNRGVILEANGESQGLNDESRAKVELKFLTDQRKDDIMFEAYRKDARVAIRQVFRLPPLYVGGTDDINRATAQAAMTLAEQQLFGPEREKYDEWFNINIMRRGLLEGGIQFWTFQSQGPRIVGTEDFIAGVKAFSEAGALSVNHAIEMANAAFRMEMSKLPFAWADMPYFVVRELMDKGIPLKGLSDMVEDDPAARALMQIPQQFTGLPPDQNIAPTQGTILNAQGEPVLLWDNDSPLDPIEKELYRKLMLFDKAVTKHRSAQIIVDHHADSI